MIILFIGLIIAFIMPLLLVFFKDWYSKTFTILCIILEAVIFALFPLAGLLGIVAAFISYRIAKQFTYQKLPDKYQNANMAYATIIEIGYNTIVQININGIKNFRLAYNVKKMKIGSKIKVAYLNSEELCYPIPMTIEEKKLNAIK